MMKRNLFIGFGLGLVFSAGFLSVFSNTTPSMELSKEQLEAYAKAQNYVLVPKDQYEELKQGTEKGNQAPTRPTSPVKPSEPTAPSKVTPPPAEGQPGQAVPPAGTPSPTTTVPPTQGTVPSADGPKTPQSPAAPAEIVTVTIPYKATGIDTARLLVEAGLLPQKNQFIATLKKQNKLNRIRVGTYKIPKGTSTEKIIEIITTPPAQ